MLLPECLKKIQQTLWQANVRNARMLQLPKTWVALAMPGLAAAVGVDGVQQTENNLAGAAPLNAFLTHGRDFRVIWNQ